MVSDVLTIRAGTQKGAALASSASMKSQHEKPEGLLAVLLDARGAQARKTVLVDGDLPAQEFLRGQRVALTGFLEAQQAAANGGDNLRLAADDPTAGAGWRQVGNRQGTAVGPDDILDPRAVGFGHDTLTQKFNDLVENMCKASRLMFS
jgi:hypothetical protein